MNPLTIAILAGGLLLLWFVIQDRLLDPIIVRKTVAKILKDIDKIKPGPLENPKYGTISCTSEFVIFQAKKKPPIKLAWTDIEEVHAFKKDLFTTDLIYLAFKLAGGEEYIEIHEEMDGYHEMQNSLPERLPGYSYNWFTSVAFPAFETNHQIVWRRNAEPNKALEQISVASSTTKAV